MVSRRTRDARQPGFKGMIHSGANIQEQLSDIGCPLHRAAARYGGMVAVVSMFSENRLGLFAGTSVGLFCYLVTGGTRSKARWWERNLWWRNEGVGRLGTGTDGLCYLVSGFVAEFGLGD